MQRQPSIYTAIFTAVCVTIFGAACVHAAGKHAVPTELYRFVLDAQGKVQIADKKMFAYMQATEKLVCRYFHRYGRFPQSITDLDEFAPRENITHVKNPYLDHEYMTRELPQDTSPVLQIEVLADYGLSKNSMLELAKHPPKNWDGEPGTIVLMHNSEDLFAIRGCGLTRKPISDATTGNALYIFRNTSE